MWVATHLGPKGDMRCRGALSAVLDTPAMHIPRWYWFNCLYPNLAFAERSTVENYSRFQQIKPEDLVGEWTFCDALFRPGRLT